MDMSTADRHSSLDANRVDRQANTMKLALLSGLKALMLLAKIFQRQYGRGLSFFDQLLQVSEGAVHPRDPS